MRGGDATRRDGGPMRCARARAARCWTYFCRPTESATSTRSDLRCWRSQLLEEPVDMAGEIWAALRVGGDVWR